jgi:hypothetical protein
MYVGVLSAKGFVLTPHQGIARFFDRKMLCWSRNLPQERYNSSELTPKKKIPVYILIMAA